MRYLIFTDRREVRQAFEESGYQPLEFHSYSALRQVCSSIRGALVYLDCHEENRESLKKNISYLGNRPDLRYGIIEYSVCSDDPACYFHTGAVDYIGAELIARGLSCKRLEEAQLYRPIDSRYILEQYDESVPYSGVDWNDVKEGKEYVFAMVYAGLDNMSEMRELLGPGGTEKFISEFRIWLDEHMDAWYGYRWLWNDGGGVYLFPFDGKNYYAMEAAMECFLNRKIARFSVFDVKSTFRLVLHLGSTVYRKRGETGEIVSDSLNSLFHMAYRDESRDELVISQEVKNLIPPSLHPYLTEEGRFEGRQLYKLKRFV